MMKLPIKPFFKLSILFAAYTLCQIPWSNKFVANTAIKKVRPAVIPLYSIFIFEGDLFNRSNDKNLSHLQIYKTL